jgi:maltose O-acetyltransferase
MSLYRRLINKIRGNMDVDSLVQKGLIVGENVFINFGCVIDESFCWLIELGNNVTLAPHVHILAHDASTKRELGYTKLGGVKIGNNVFIGAGTIILPGTNIGDRVVVGAGSIVTKNIPDNSLAIGNPAKVVCSYDEYMSRQKDKMKSAYIYSKDFTIYGNVTTNKKDKMKQELGTENTGFIV